MLRSEAIREKQKSQFRNGLRMSVSASKNISASVCSVFKTVMKLKMLDQKSNVQSVMLLCSFHSFFLSLLFCCLDPSPLGDEKAEG